MRLTAGLALLLLPATAGVALAAPPLRPFPQHVAYAAGTIRPTVRTQAQQDDDVRAYYDQWKASFVVAAGNGPGGTPLFRVTVGSTNPARTVSEGQGYGMMITALMAGHDPDARLLFDGLWTFSRLHPSHEDSRLMSFEVPEKPDVVNSAFDGDCDIAYGLLLADAQWGSSGAIDYRQAALTVLAGILQSTIGPNSHLPMLGDWTDPAGDAYNQYTPRTSDLVLDHFRAFGRATGDPAWDAVVSATQALVSSLQSQYAPATGLLPDFVVPVSAADHTPKPAPPGFLEGPNDGAYYYNAVRDPWRLGTDALLSGDPVSLAHVRAISNWAAGAAGGDPVAVNSGYALNGTPLSPQFYSVIFVAPLGVAAMTVPAQQQWLNDVYANVRAVHEDYYEDSVTLLSLLVMTGNYWAAAPNPSLSIGDVSKPEGGTGTSALDFTVTLSAASASTVTVHYATANGTATAGTDYVAASGTLSFNPGQTARTVSVSILGDADVEPNETFTVDLSAPTGGATVLDAQAVGTIVNDDPNADVSAAITDGVETAAAGQTLVYTITVANAGPNAAAGVPVSDVLPSGLINATWTCAGAGGAACGAANGSGGIAQTVSLPVGGSVVYTLTATVKAAPASVAHAVTVSVPAGFGDPNPANNTAVDSDLLICDPATAVVVPDGRATSGSLGLGAGRWYVASLAAGSSYAVEVTSGVGAAGLPTLVVYEGDDGCTGVATAMHDTSGNDPRAGAAVRVSVPVAEGTDPRYRFRVENDTGGVLPYALQMVETTLYGAAWSTNGSYDTYYSLQNTTGAGVTGVLTFRDAAGNLAGQATIAVPAGRTVGANTQALGLPRNRTGTVRFRHDGPSGAILGTAAIGNFTLALPYIQPVKLGPVRER